VVVRLTSTAFDHLDDMLTVFEKTESNGASAKTSAAPVNLFTVNKDCEKLPDSEAVELHDVVAKTLHVTKRARPDACAQIVFLTARVREPDEDEWKKTFHLMRRVGGTRDLPLVLSANGSHVLKWWVDASFAVHPDLRDGHAGGGLSLGRGFLVVSSTKQKLNNRSSAETELVGADNFMPAACWTRCFMEAQGHVIRDNVSHQDNKSSILLEEIGKALSTKGTQHIDIRCFFVADQIDKNELSMEWCPTGNMIGDCATKALQVPTPAEEPGAKKSKSIGDKNRRPKSSRQMFGDRIDRHHRSVLGSRDLWNESLSVRRTYRSGNKEMLRLRDVIETGN
jgi:hypothetical protein